MKNSIMKHLHQLEQRTKAAAGGSPSLVMISYDEMQHKWSISEIDGRKDGKRKEHQAERLQDYVFPPSFNGRVILDTFGSPDATIYENLFVFTMDELTREYDTSETEGIFIESITEGKKLDCNIEFGRRVYGKVVT